MTARSPYLIPPDYCVGPHKILDLRDLEEDLLARVMAAADVGDPTIGNRVYQNVIRRYHTCVDFGGRHIESFFL